MTDITHALALAVSDAHFAMDGTFDIKGVDTVRQTFHMTYKDMLNAGSEMTYYLNTRGEIIHIEEIRSYNFHEETLEEMLEEAFELLEEY